ncbi:MAG: sigma-E processing peptidase SpoIIGA [Clostridia bacterium]|nr:sigma-E processing peptidase SpoIIGA [Clostridia bacterium]
MEVYIEYAFLENFLFDSVLLFLALYATRTEIKVWRVLVGGIVGGAFSLLFPLLILPYLLSQILKFSVGFLLCLLSYPPIKNKKEWGRYAFTSVFFFIFSFGFGGALLAVLSNDYTRIPSFAVMLAFAVLTGLSCFLVRKFYQKRRIYQSMTECLLLYREKSLKTMGFIDSGNQVRKNGIPVCFVSPDLFYDLCGEEVFLKEGGQVCDEIRIRTLGGEKTVRAIQGELGVMDGGEIYKERVYFALSTNMIAREYKILISAECIKREDRRDV